MAREVQCHAQGDPAIWCLSLYKIKAQDRFSPTVLGLSSMQPYPTDQEPPQRSELSSVHIMTSQFFTSVLQAGPRSLSRICTTHSSPYMAPAALRGWNLSRSRHVGLSDSNVSGSCRVPCTCLVIDKCLLIKSLLTNGDDLISEYRWVRDSCSLWTISQGFCQRRQKRIPNKLGVFQSPTWTNL